MTQKGMTDVFVVGGGPAGLVAAIAARRKGFTVALADGAEPPIDKPCGEGLMPETQAALRKLGITVDGGEGYEFRGIQFIQSGKRIAADFPEGSGLGLRRPLLHATLVARAEQCGVRLLWKTPVSAITSEGVQLKSGLLPARWIVGADGGGSRVRRWSGLEATAQRRQRFATRRHYRVRPWSEYVEIHWGQGAQAYVTPIGKEEVCIVVLAERSEDADFAKVLEGLPRLRARLCGAELASRERGAITVMHKLRKVIRGNVALIGDASGGVDAITGEGLRLAFLQALALAEAMERSDLAGYERAHRELARRPMRMGKLMLLLGRHEKLRQRSFAALESHPQLFEDLLTMHVGRATNAQMLGTGLQLGWQFLTV
ncbi:MAG: NAD(P)/FAD-dependent oxidoreductase [Candidatus Acidiferrales bacterium]